MGNKVFRAGFNNLSVPDVPTSSTGLEISLNDWESFGSDNLFPQAMAALARQNSQLRGIVNRKATFTVGKQFAFDENNRRLQDQVNRANPTESLRQIMHKVFLDDYIFGNSFIELVRDRKGSFVNMFHKHPTKVRVGKKKYEGFGLVHPDWSQVVQYRNLIKPIALYPNWEASDGFLRSMIHVKRYEPDFIHYGLSDWISGTNAAAIGYKTDKWNISRLDNNFNASGVLLVEGQISESEAKELGDEMEKKFTGEGNAGRLMYIVKLPGGGHSEFTPITQTNDADWQGLHSQSDHTLLKATSWHEILMGSSVAGKLGQTQEIRNTYNLAMSTTIIPKQEDYLEIIRNVYEKELNLDAQSLGIINLSITDILENLTADKYTRIWEARKLAGFDYDEDDPEQQEYIDDGQQKTLRFE